MKKFLLILGVLAIGGLTCVQAAPAPFQSGAPIRGQMHQPTFQAHINAGYAPVISHNPPPPPHSAYYHNCSSAGGVFARHSYRGFNYGCNCKLRYNKHLYHQPYPHHGGAYVSIGIPIRF